MITLNEFLRLICETSDDNSLNKKRETLAAINRYFFQMPDTRSKAFALGADRNHVSPYHVFWETNHEELLGLTIDRECVSAVVTSLSKTITNYGTQILACDLHPDGLNDEEIARVRFLTSTQESGLTVGDSQWQAYVDNPSAFDLESVSKDPSSLISALGLEKMSQADKRRKYAMESAKMALGYNTTFLDLPGRFNNDAKKLVEFLAESSNMGFGYKIAHMLVRDLVELDVWHLTNLEQVGVASDVHVMKVALRTGILKTAMPILSSFLDIFCYQYVAIQKKTTEAWTEVWNLWMDVEPDTCVLFPGAMDFFIFSLGRNLCKDNVVWFNCAYCKHEFAKRNARSKKCPVCGKAAEETGRSMQCIDYKSIPIGFDNGFRPGGIHVELCPFVNACNPSSPNFIPFDPPKSISILQRTGWTTAYSDPKKGGGGLRS